MILKTVNDPNLMWTAYDMLSDLFLTTSNSTVIENKLVMGKGHAQQVKQRIGRNIEKSLWKAIEARVVERVMAGEWKGPIFKQLANGHRVYGDYYLLVSDRWPSVKVGLFQTKRHYSDTAEKTMPELSGYEYTVKNMIYWSTQALERWCLEHPESRVDMPFPGIGAGECAESEILPIIERLPDTVYVWKLHE